MLELQKSGNRHKRDVPRHRIKWSITWSCGEDFLSQWEIKRKNGCSWLCLNKNKVWMEFGDLSPLLPICYPFLPRVVIFCFLHSVILYGKAIWPVKVENMIRLQRNDKQMVRWMRNVRLENKISDLELRNKLQLNNMRECLHNRKLIWFIYPDRMEESLWPSEFKNIG